MTQSSHKKSPNKILITSALPYVNNIPHMGNIIGCVLSADVFARYNRSQGNKVLYICGTDEHGTATETKALEEGLSPQQICDKYFAIHKSVYTWFNISFDVFGRTSKENHHRITQDIFFDVKKNGYILEKEVEQSYCETDKRFLADRFVEGECPHCHFSDARGDQCDGCGKLLNPLELINAKCKICGNTPISKKSTHLFIDLAKLQGKLATWVEIQSKKGDWRDNAITTTKAWLDRGLEPRAITRDLTWGVPVPGMEGKVFYVWFDAPIGYISITDQGTTSLQGDAIDWHDWWQDPENTRLYQFMAKDNIPFHTIVFPATMLASGKDWTMLHHIDSTEYLQHEDGKFSKSRGIGLFGDDAIKTGVPADVFRYYLLVNRPETSDTVFSWKDLQDKLNKELLANLGNLVNRTLVFLQKYYENEVPEEVLDDVATNFLEYISEMEIQITDLLERCQEKEALRAIMTLSSKGNQYFQEQEPWKSRTENPEACRRAMFVLANLIKDLAILIEPFMPDTARRIFLQLGLGNEGKTWADLGNLSIKGAIGTPEPLFAKLEDKDIIAIKENLKKDQKKIDLAISAVTTVAKTTVVKKPLRLQAGKLLTVEQHPRADKLFVETVDFGSEVRTIVSGLVGHYSAKELVGKTAIFVTNLKPANLRGVESNGMIMAASDKFEGKERVEVICIDAMPGTVLELEDKEDNNEDEGTTVGDELNELVDEITIDDFAMHTLEAKDYNVLCDGKQLLCNGEPIRTTVVKDGKVR